MQPGQQFQDYIHMTTKKSVVGIIDAINSHSDEPQWQGSAGGVRFEVTKPHPLTGLYVRPANTELMDTYGKHGLIIRGPAKPVFDTDEDTLPRDSNADALPDFNHYDKGDDVGSIDDMIISNPKNWKVTGTIHPRAFKGETPVHVEDLPEKLRNEDFTEFNNVKYFDDSGRER